MSAMSAEPALSFDDILEAVQESRRGRWFLDEFEGRLRQTETGNILAAISKLEGVVAGMGGVGADAAALARAKAAIAQARHDIANLAPKPVELSEEGRLFAKLAEMARTTFSAAAKTDAPAAVANGIVRALRLVDELDRDLAGGIPVVKSGTEIQYFQRDADVFESLVATPELIAPAVEPVPEPMVKKEKLYDVELPQRGAKLVIHRRQSGQPEPAKPASHIPDAASAENNNGQLVSHVPPAFMTANPPVKMDTPRIVIIRRKPEELMDVPQLDRDMEATAA